MPPRAEQIPELYLGDESEKDPAQPLYYLKRAFQQTRMQAVNIVARSNNAPVTATDISSAQLAIIGEGINDDLAKVTRQLLECMEA